MQGAESSSFHDCRIILTSYLKAVVQSVPIFSWVTFPWFREILSPSASQGTHFFAILSIRRKEIFRSTGTWFSSFSSFSSNRSYPRLSLAGSSNASVRVLAGSSNASVQVLAGSSNASVLSECHLRTVCVASCRRFSSESYCIFAKSRTNLVKI